MKFIKNCAVVILSMGLALSASARGVTKAEKDEVSEAAKAAGLPTPYRFERLPASILIELFDYKKLTPEEQLAIQSIDDHNPLCLVNRALVPCPVAKHTEFGRMLTKKGGCIWSPLLSTPTKENIAPVVLGTKAMRCSSNKDEWKRILHTSLPR